MSPLNDGYGSSLPPGVTDSMIPGNRPEDEAWWRARDRAVEEIEAEVAKLDLPAWMVEMATDAIMESTDFEDYVDARMSEQQSAGPEYPYDPIEDRL